MAEASSSAALRASESSLRPPSLSLSPTSSSTPTQSPAPRRRSTLVSLPSELLQHILAHLEPIDLSRLSCSCHLLYAESHQDLLWHSFLEDVIPASLTTPYPFTSWHNLYIAYHPYWFIPRQKIWFSDHAAVGRLILARFDHRRGCIEAYSLAAERRPAYYGTLDWAGCAIYHTFDPQVKLDLNQPILRLGPAPEYLQSRRDGDTSTSASASASSASSTATLTTVASRPGPRPGRLSQQVTMNIHGASTDHLVSQLMLTRPLPPNHIHPRTDIWPPHKLPSPNNTRVRSDSPSQFHDPSHRPTTPSQLSQHHFRIRQVVDFSSMHSAIFIHPGATRLMESVHTYATLPLSAYTPTPQKPYQGIWVGDYSGHGCEFLLIVQPDDPAPLPDAATSVFETWPFSNAPMQFPDEMEQDPDEVARGAAAAASAAAAVAAVMEHAPPSPSSPSSEASFHSAVEDSTNPSHTAHASYASHASHNSNSNSNSNSSHPHSHSQATPPSHAIPRRLEAIKLTGDPNVPRGEYTFIADMSSRGHVGFAQEDIFREETRHRPRPGYSNSHPNSHSHSHSNSNSASNSMHTRSNDGSTNIGGSSSGSSSRRNGSGGGSSGSGSGSAGLSRTSYGQGAQIVKSIGHIAGRGFQHDMYIPTQLILISATRLAHHWQPYGHVSFYERVDLESLGRL